MKAKDYYEKYRQLIFEVPDGIAHTLPDGRETHIPPTTEAFNDIVHHCFVEFAKESADISAKRKVRNPFGLKSVVEEFNDKWNAMCSFFEKGYGQCPFARNGFRNMMLHLQPQLETLYNLSEEEYKKMQKEARVIKSVISMMETGKGA